MKRGTFGWMAAGLVLAAAGGAPAAAAQDMRLAQEQLQGEGVLQTALSGFQEVPTRWSPASGEFSASLNQEGNIVYALSYAGVTTPVQAAHLHLGSEGVNGGIIVFLCSNMPNPPANVPACPQQEGTVNGTLTAASVVGPEDQGIAPGEFEKLLDAMLNDAVYANVHTEQFPEGELRGQLGTGPDARAR